MSKTLHKYMAGIGEKQLDAVCVFPTSPLTLMLSKEGKERIAEVKQMDRLK